MRNWFYQDLPAPKNSVLFSAFSGMASMVVEAKQQKMLCSRDTTFGRFIDFSAGPPRELKHTWYYGIYGFSVIHVWRGVKTKTRILTPPVSPSFADNRLSMSIRQGIFRDIVCQEVNALFHGIVVVRGDGWIRTPVENKSSTNIETQLLNSRIVGGCWQRCTT